MTALETLSVDAKLMLAGHFSFGQKTKLTFQTPWNIAPRAAAALAEAVTAGLLQLEVGKDGLYAHTYRATEDLSALRAWMEKNKAKAKDFFVMVSSDLRSERPPTAWPVPAGYKRHPK